jgi:hypothetical protein
MSAADRFRLLEECREDHEARIKRLEEWRVEIKTIVALLKWTFGASALAAILGILNLIDMIRLH